EAAVRPVRVSQRNNEGGEMIELSSHDLSRGERDRHRRGRQLRGGFGTGRPATKTSAATGHDQILNRLRLVPAADPGEISGNRVALRAVSSAAEVDLALGGVSHQDV